MHVIVCCVPTEVQNGEVSILNKGTSVKLHLKSDKQGLTDENFPNSLALKSNGRYTGQNLESWWCSHHQDTCFYWCIE